MLKSYLPQVYTCGFFFSTFQFFLVTIPPVLRDCLSVLLFLHKCKHVRKEQVVQTYLIEQRLSISDLGIFPSAGRNAPPPCVAATSFTHMPALPRELLCSPCLSGSPFSAHRNTQVLPSPPHRTVFLHIPTHASTEHSACSLSSVLFPPSQVLGLLHSCLPAFACPHLSGVPWENGSEVTDVIVPLCVH